MHVEVQQARVPSNPTAPPLPRSRHRTFREIEIEEQAPIVRTKATGGPRCTSSPPPSQDVQNDEESHQMTPRTRRVLQVVNTRDLAQIKLLKGVGTKKAEGIIAALEGHGADEDGNSVGRSSTAATTGPVAVTSLAQLAKMKGVSVKTVESMRVGIS